MPPKRSSRPARRSKQAKSQAKTKTQPYARPSNKSAPPSPKRYDFARLKRDQLRREAEKRGCGHTTTNKGTIEILREWDEFAARGLVPPARGTARAHSRREEKQPQQQQRREKAPAVGQARLTFEQMNMIALREECSRRGIKANPKKSVTIERLLDHDANQGAPPAPTDTAARLPQPQVRRPTPKPIKGEDAAKTADRMMEARLEITSGPVDNFPAMTFRQHQVIGDGNCLYRAFARAFYGNQNVWAGVRAHVREWYDLVTAPGNEYTPESLSRRPLYSALNVIELNAVERVRLTAHLSRGEDRSRFIAKDSSNLYRQITAGAAWGDSSMMQVIADAYDVEIFSFAHNPSGAFELQVRGRFGSRQIFLANYPSLVHWSALQPVDDQPVTQHLNIDESLIMFVRGPISAEVDPQDAEFVMERPRVLWRTRPAPFVQGVPRRIVVPEELLHEVETEAVEEEEEEEEEEESGGIKEEPRSRDGGHRRDRDGPSNGRGNGGAPGAGAGGDRGNGEGGAQHSPRRQETHRRGGGGGGQRSRSPQPSKRQRSQEDEEESEPPRKRARSTNSERGLRGSSRVLGSRSSPRPHVSSSFAREKDKSSSSMRRSTARYKTPEEQIGDSFYRHATNVLQQRSEAHRRAHARQMDQVEHHTTGKISMGLPRQHQNLRRWTPLDRLPEHFEDRIVKSVEISRQGKDAVLPTPPTERTFNIRGRTSTDAFIDHASATTTQQRRQRWRPWTPFHPSPPKIGGNPSSGCATQGDSVPCLANREEKEDEEGEADTEIAESEAETEILESDDGAEHDSLAVEAWLGQAELGQSESEDPGQEIPRARSSSGSGGQHRSSNEENKSPEYVSWGFLEGRS